MEGKEKESYEKNTRSNRRDRAGARKGNGELGEKSRKEGELGYGKWKDTKS